MRWHERKPPAKGSIFAYGRWMTVKKYRQIQRTPPRLKRFERRIVVSGDVSPEFLERMRDRLIVVRQKGV